MLSDGEGSINVVNSSRLLEQGHQVLYENNWWLFRLMRKANSAQVVPLWVGPANASTTTPVTADRAEALHRPDIAERLRDYESASDGRPVTRVELTIYDGKTPGSGAEGAHRLADGTAVTFEEWRYRLCQYGQTSSGDEIVLNYVEFSPRGDLRSHSFSDEYGESNTPEAVRIAVGAAQIMAAQIGFGI
jgi:hypothetical protein